MEVMVVACEEEKDGPSGAASACRRDDLEAVLERLAEAYPGPHLERALATLEADAAQEIQVREVVAECIVKIVVESFDRNSAPAANLLRIRSGLADARELLDQVVRRSDELWRRSRARGSSA